MQWRLVTKAAKNTSLREVVFLDYKTGLGLIVWEFLWQLALSWSRVPETLKMQTQNWVFYKERKKSAFKAPLKTQKAESLVKMLTQSKFWKIFITFRVAKHMKGQPAASKNASLNRNIKKYPYWWKKSHSAENPKMRPFRIEKRVFGSRNTKKTVGGPFGEKKNFPTQKIEKKSHSVDKNKGEGPFVTSRVCKVRARHRARSARHRGKQPS